MMLRSQTVAALAVLIVALGLMFVLVGQAGVATRVFLPEATLTYTPTVGPSPTPLPEGNVANWVESQPGALTYSDSSITARVAYQTMTLDSFIQQNQLQAPTQPAPYSFLQVLDQLRTSLEDQASSIGLTVTPDSFGGPEIRLVGTTPVAQLRATFPPQTESTSGQPFQGVDLALMVIDRGNGEISFVQYQLQGERNLVVYNDFVAWLAANMATLTGQAPETTGTPGTPSGTPGTPGATPPAETATPAAEVTGAAEAPAEGAVPQAETATASPLPEVTGEATAVPPSASATPTPAAETSATPSAAEGAAPQAASETATPVPEAAVATPGTPVAAADTWSEIEPGRYVSSTNPNAMIEYGPLKLTDIAAQLGMDTSGGGASLTPMDVLNTIRTDFEARIAGMGIALESDAMEGPVAKDFGGVPVTYLHMIVPASTSSDGTPIPGQEFWLGLIDMGGGNFRAIDLLYEGDPDPTVYANFQAWLEANAARLSEPEPTATPSPATATPTPAN